jgi:lipopolysaccharide heptosyltransferase II
VGGTLPWFRTGSRAGTAAVAKAAHAAEDPVPHAMKNSAPPDLSHVHRIYVRAPNWVGDLVMATATFQRLRTAFPRAHIGLGLRPHLQGLLTGTPWFDALQPTAPARTPRHLWRQVRAMREQAYDLAVVLPNSLETGLVPFLARVPLRLGYRQGRPGLMNLGLRADVRRRWFNRRWGPRRTPVPMPQYYHDLLDCLGIAAGTYHPQLAVTPTEAVQVADYLACKGIGAGERLLLLVVGANYGASKLWLPERFAAVARHFQERHGLRAAVLVGPNEVELGREIAAAGGAVAMVDPVLSLDGLKALVARGTLMVTGDTGPRHLAVALDKPVVCLIGPTDPNYTNYCLEHSVVIRRDLECSPCQRKVCPLGHHRCMRDISVEAVVAAGERLLAATPA